MKNIAKLVVLAFASFAFSSHHPPSSPPVDTMQESGASISILLDPPLKNYDVPQEVPTDIIKEGWTDALVWANTFKEEDLPLYFLREGSPYGSVTQKGSKEDHGGIAARRPGRYLSSC